MTHDAMHGRGLSLLIVASALASGCQLGRTMFQMDSNSRTPFFGVDLLADDEQEQDIRASSVADLRDGPREATVKPVVEATASVRKKPSLLEKLNLKRAPDRIPLELTTPEGEIATGPVEEFR